MSVLDIARPGIRSLQPYAAAAQVDDCIRLNANELPTAAVDSPFRRPLHRYPEVRPRRLQAALAEHYACAPAQLLVTRGSSEAIDLLIRSFCRPGEDSIVIARPTFSMYKHYAALQEAAVIEVSGAAEQGLAPGLDALNAARRPHSRLVFVCSPNNPTGQSVDRPALELLLQQCRDQAVVVVDEAYIEFASTPSAAELLPEYDNLVVLRTLSKALGLAGTRCGALLAQADVVRMLAAVQAPYALSTPVVEIVEQALDADAVCAAANAVATVVAERTRMAAALARCPHIQAVWPSDANFLLLRTSRAARIAAHCAERSILIRHFGGDLENFLRISIGTPQENDALLRALEELPR